MNKPLLLLLFNRPDLTAGLLRILESIVDRRIYIAIDGPRSGSKEDAYFCAEVVRIVDQFSKRRLTQCRTLVQCENLGCGPGVKAALDWFFENEECGIILEDDCHPNADFFRFQDEMLERYRDDDSVFMVSGSSFLPRPLTIEAPFFFTKYTQIWGWGAWRRSWKKYEFLLAEKDRSDWMQVIDDACPEIAERFYWMREFNKLCGKPVPHTWDYQLQFSVWKSKSKCIWPSTNLVTNQGLRSDATHTILPNDYLCQKSREIGSNLDVQPAAYIPELDKLLFWFHFLEGDVNRFRYILFESDESIQSNLREIAALGDIYTSRRIMADPMLGEVVDLGIKWIKKMLRNK